MTTISNYNYFTNMYTKKTTGTKVESETDSAETKTETTAIAEETKTSSQTGDSQYFMALAYEQQSNYSTYITLSSQPLNNTLTKYRDTYPNIIGFTAKTQSGLNSLCNDYKTKLCGLTSKFANCKTQEEFDSKMKELKSEISKLMDEYKAKYDDIFAITSALPALSDVRAKAVGSEIDMHDELEAILNGVKNSDDNTSSSKKTEVKLDRSTITMKMQEMKDKNKEYKNKLEKAQKAKNEVEIDENQSLVTATEKLIDVYAAVLKGFNSLGQ